MADETNSTPPPADEGFLHSLATSLGLDPEAVKTAAKAIYAHPVETAKQIGGEIADEAQQVSGTPLGAAKDVGRGVAAQVGVNPDATEVAKNRFAQPGVGNKLAGGLEYLESGVPLVGGNLVKASEQGAQGNLAGAAGTTVGTVAPFLTETEPVQNLKTHVAETAKNFVSSAKEGLERAANATAPEGSLEAGFAKLGGKKVKEPTEAPQGGHAGGGVASEEELARPGRFVKVSRSGQLSDQGKTPDFNLRPGEVGYQVKPDGSVTKIDGQETPAHKNAIQGYANDVYPKPKAEFQQTLAERGQLPNQKVAFPPEVGATYVGGLSEPTVHEINGDEPATSNPNSISSRLAETYGTTTDPSKAGFILADGSMIPLHGEHNTMLDHLYNTYGDISQDDAERTAFINNENAIRTRFRTGKGGQEVVFSVPKDGVTPAQIDQLKKSVAAVGRNGNALIEISEGDGASTRKEFVRPSDVEPMLKELGAHPDQKASAISFSTDSNGTKWATGPGDVRVSIPNRIPENEVQAYATQKIAEQAAMQEAVKAKVAAPEVSPNETLQGSAQKYAKAKGMPEIDHNPVPVDLDRAKQIAEDYDKAEHAPNDPKVKAAYDALKAETKDQFHHLRDDLGLKFQPQDEDPYSSAGEMMNDIKKNNQLKVFTGSSTGPDHPLSEIDPETGESYNTLFRWVHDAMGHAAGGNDFSENGEKSATEAHAQMYSDKARPAMRAETEGQTSWFFHNPEVESGRTEPGAFAEQKATILPDRSSDWHETAGKAAATDEAGGIDPHTGKSDTTGVGTEVMPELRQPLDHAPTAEDFKNFYDQHKEIFDAHPELRIGWDNKSAAEGGHEINVGAVGKDAARVAKKLDQKSAFDIAKGEIVPTGGTGLRTEFPNYSLEERLKDLRGENQSDTPGFEHLSKDIYDHLEPDEREYLKGNKTLQRNVMAQYHKIAPSVAETTNAMLAGAALGGWWKRYIDVFHDLADGGEQVANTIGPSHAEVLKQWHAAVSGNKSVEDANNLAWHSYADWLDAGKPTDRKSINDIIKANAAQPEGSAKKGNAAISDTLDKKGKVVSKGLDTTKLYNLVNSPEMRGEKPFGGDVFREDSKNPLMGSTEGARKIPSMGASVAGKGNLNRLVIDAHIRDFYGHTSSGGPAAQYIADSAHLRQAAKALGLKGGEGQEQLWGTVLGLKSLLKEGFTPEESGSKLNAGVINRIGKDYAEVIANDPEITKPGGILDRLKDKYGIGRGSAGFIPADSKASSASAGEGKPAGSQAPVDTSQLGETARRIRGQISDSKIKKPAAVAEPEDEDTSFNFGANVKTRGKFGEGLAAALKGLRKPGGKIPTTLHQNINTTDNMNDPDTRFAAARHEAAHSVISEALAPGSVNSTGLTNGGGVTEIEPPAGKTTIGQLSPDEIRTMIATSYAGGLAEPGGTTARHVSGDQAERALILGSRASTPVQNAERLVAGGVVGTDPMLQGGQMQAEARARVNALLADPAVQKQIDMLTSHIAARGKLSGNEVRGLLKQPLTK